jgi:hypothetical protein
MPLYEVAIRAWVQAADEADARLIALGEESREPGRLVLAEAAQVLPPDAVDADRITSFARMLDDAVTAPAGPRPRRREASRPGGSGPAPGG